jgi:hypothetical protein
MHACVVQVNKLLQSEARAPHRVVPDDVVGYTTMQILWFTHTHTYIHAYKPLFKRLVVPVRLHSFISHELVQVHFVTFTHTYIHTYIHTHIHTYIHAYTHTYNPLFKRLIVPVRLHSFISHELVQVHFMIFMHKYEFRNFFD